MRCRTGGKDRKEVHELLEVVGKANSIPLEVGERVVGWNVWLKKV